MADNESTTTTLRRISPWMAWVRANPGLLLMVASAVLTNAVGWGVALEKFSNFKDAQAELTAKVDKLIARETTEAAMQEEIVSLRRDIDRNDEKWERAETGADIRVTRRKR